MNEELKYIIGGNIRLAREKAGFSQAELAEKLGITGASISAYENGVSIPSVPVILQIAKTLNVSIDFLCGYEKSNAFSQYPEILKILLKLLQTEEVGAFIASVKAAGSIPAWRTKSLEIPAFLRLFIFPTFPI